MHILYTWLQCIWKRLAIWCNCLNRQYESTPYIRTTIKQQQQQQQHWSHNWTLALEAFERLPNRANLYSDFHCLLIEITRAHKGIHALLFESKASAHTTLAYSIIHRKTLITIATTNDNANVSAKKRKNLYNKCIYSKALMTALSVCVLASLSHTQMICNW